MLNMNILIETLYVYVLSYLKVKFLFSVIVLKNICLEFFHALLISKESFG